MTDAPVSNRVKIVYVSLQLWLSQVVRGRLAQCINLPDDAQVVRAMPMLDYMGRDTAFVIESQSFDPIEDGGVIPELRLLFRDATPRCSTCDHGVASEQGNGRTFCKAGVSRIEDHMETRHHPIGFGCMLWSQEITP